MLEKFEDIAKEICAKHGVGLYDIGVIKTGHGKVLCVFITKVNGVNITDCTNVSKELNAYLDSQDMIKGSYTLEVSSPGIERSLKLKKHYLSAINEWVSLKVDKTPEMSDTLDIKQNENIKSLKITGLLKEVYHEYITVESEKNTIHVPFSQIKKAKTIYKTLKKEN